MDNPIISMTISLLAIVIPGGVEIILAKLSYVVVPQKVDIFLEELYLTECRMALGSSRLHDNKYTIERTAKKNDINPVLLTTILSLEMIYRERIVNRLAEFILCKFMKRLAIKKDVSVGMAQIKISTAEEVLQDDAVNFIDKLLDDSFNIELCGAYVKQLLEKYEVEKRSIEESEENVDVFVYLATEYLGGNYYERTQSVLIYSAALRNAMKGRKLRYFPSSMMFPCEISILNFSIDEESEFRKLAIEGTEYYVSDEDGNREGHIICRTEELFQEIQDYLMNNNLKYVIK